MTFLYRITKATFPLTLVPLWALIVLCSGCSVQRSVEYYWPTVTQTPPPKPQNVRIPILEQAPKRPYTVIGKMAFDSDTDEMDSLYKKLQYNARRNGADAVIMKLTRSPDPRSTTLYVDAKMIVFR